ncbi:MAG: lamin tail domain-containing protein, partial [Bacteroidota bacterium]
MASKVGGVLSANQIRLSFSESINSSSGENTNNYSANNGLANPQVAAINPENTTQIDLTFASNFSDGQENTLTAQDLEDGAGNVLNPNPSQINFTYFAPFEAGFRDVVINEIMADPNPPVNLPNAEYVELFNASNQAVDLNNWSLSGASLPSFLLAPNSFIILCDEGDEALFNSFGSVIGLANWNTISNAGEEITLLDQNGATIDRLEFNLTWYQDSEKDDGGFSLEQINPNLPCNNQSNWIASTSTQGGTPGQQNSVFSDTPDTQAPSLINVTLLDSSQVQIIFSESMDEASLINVANYSINNGIGVDGITTNSPENTQVTLSLNPALSVGINYTLTLSNISDCSGNALSNTSISFARGFRPGFNELIFTEIMADPRGDAQPLNPLPEAEFIELFNRSSRVLDLQGLSFSDAGSTFSLPQQSLAPGEYLILCDNSFVPSFQEFGRVLGLNDFPDLLNRGEQLTLSDESSNIIFALEYDDSWYQNRSKADGGWTLEIIDTDNPCGEASNWIASEAERGGTPGVASSVAASRPDLTAPRLLRAEALDSLNVRLIFNEKMNPAGNGSFSIDNGIDVENTSVEAPNFRIINLSLGTPLTRGIQYQVTVQNVADCSGNLIADNNQALLGLAEAGDSLDIILNELLFNPRTGGNDFVELYNNSDKFINLNNWKLANLDDGVLANQRIITEEDYILPPLGYLVLSADIGNIQSEYPLGNPDVFLEMSSLPSYPDNEGTFFLINDQGALVERFDYLDDFHFPLLDDDDGVSLERIAFRLPSNDRNSWQSAASTVGFASPGNPNSQVRREDPEDGRVVISPQVFSPDGDGFEDFTTVNLDFEQGGVLVDVIIYDSRGREIRNLANRQLLGANQATFTW